MISPLRTAINCGIVVFILPACSMARTELTVCGLEGIWFQVKQSKPNRFSRVEPSHQTYSPRYLQQSLKSCTVTLILSSRQRQRLATRAVGSDGGASRHLYSNLHSAH